MSQAPPPFATELVAALPRLRRYARSLTRSSDDAEDLVQMTAVRALRYQDNFALRVDEDSMLRWLSTVMHSQWINECRRRKTNKRKLTDLRCHRGNVSVPPEATEARVLARDVSRVLAALAPEQRQAVVLTALNGASYEDLATAAEVPLGTVRSRLSRGRAKAREFYESE